jgi:hypothetical protein
MLRKALLASALAFQPAQVVPQTVEQSAIPLVTCSDRAGTAFRIGPSLLLSVAHVTSAARCEIDGQPIKVIYTSRTADFSILEDRRHGDALTVDCGGFRMGRLYIAVGHARGLDTLTAVPMVATGKMGGGMALLVGIFTAQPGQSGGAIIDAETKQVVGTINTADWAHGITGSVELKGTSVCRGAA